VPKPDGCRQDQKPSGCDLPAGFPDFALDATEMLVAETPARCC